MKHWFVWLRIYKSFPCKFPWLRANYFVLISNTVWLIFFITVNVFNLNLRNCLKNIQKYQRILCFHVNCSKQYFVFSTDISQQNIVGISMVIIAWLVCILYSKDNGIFVVKPILFVKCVSHVFLNISNFILSRLIFNGKFIGR